MIFLFDPFPLMANFFSGVNKYFSFEIFLNGDVVNVFLFSHHFELISFFDPPSPKILGAYIIKFYFGLLDIPGGNLILRRRDFEKEEEEIKGLRDFMIRCRLLALGRMK